MDKIDTWLEELQSQVSPGVRYVLQQKFGLSIQDKLVELLKIYKNCVDKCANYSVYTQDKEDMRHYSTLTQFEATRFLENSEKETTLLTYEEDTKPTNSFKEDQTGTITDRLCLNCDQVFIGTGLYCSDKCYLNSTEQKSETD